MVKSLKNRGKETRQQKITETWNHNLKSTGGIKKSTPVKKSSSSGTFASPKPVSKAKSKTKKQPTLINKENQSSDNEIITSSQDTHESELRKKINKTILAKRQSPRRTPQKGNKLLSPVSVASRLSITESEINDIYDNIIDKDPIEMTHDIEALLTSDQMSCESLTQLQSSNVNNIESTEKEKIEEQDVEDPLQIDKEVDNNSNTERSSDSDSSISSNDSQQSAKKNKQKKESVDSTNNLPSHLIQKLKKLEIKFLHKVPPQHQVDSCAGTRPLNHDELIAFQKFGPLKRGLFSESEDKILKQNWTDFCRIHKWDENLVEPFLNRINPVTNKYYMPQFNQRINFVQFLANGLPWRSLFSVLTRFKTLNKKYKSGKYTAAENKKIMKRLSKLSSEEMRNQVSILAKEMNRNRVHLWTHYQVLKKRYNITNPNDTSSCNEDSKLKRIFPQKYKCLKNTQVSKVEWTYPVVKRFLDELLATTSSKHLNELKNQCIDEKLWIKMQESMNIDHKVLEDFWNLQLHMQLFCPKPVYLNDLQVQLIEYLYKHKDEIEKLCWKTISSNFDGITPSLLSRLYHQLSNYAETEINTINFSDVINYLHSNYVHKLLKKPRDVVLPKLDHKLSCLYKIKEEQISHTTLNKLFDVKLEECQY